MSNDLTSLKNIGNTSALWLTSVGINSREQLETIGPVEAYLRIHQRGIKTSKVLLYALQGALQDTHWNDIDEALKKSLWEDVCAQMNTTT